jgi:hypothetical protein
MPESLLDFMKSVVTADDPELELARRTVEAARAEHPDLPFAIRACAIPQHFDANVVGVLRGEPDDAAGNDELLKLLSHQAFVTPRAPGSYVYHDLMRERLLRDWQSDEGRAEFEELNARLLDYYWERHESVDAAGRDLAHAGHVIRRASVDRYVQIASALERSLLAALLEALYHAAVAGPDEAYVRFVSAFERNESAERFAVCEAALAATREYLASAQAEADASSVLARLEYWEGRLLVARGRPNEAEGVLEAAVAHAPDPAFALGARAQLVLALWRADRLADAAAACEEYKALAERAENVGQIFLATYQLASLKWSVEEFGAAIEFFRETIVRAQSDDNGPREALARLGLAGVLSAAGRADDAFAQAFRALYISRTDQLDDDDLAMSVAERFADLFGRKDRRYADTLYAEARSLSPAADDSLAALDQRIRYVNVLRTSGQVRRAGRVLEAARQKAPKETAELLLEEALTHEASGSPDAAIELYDKIVGLEDGGAAPYVIAAAYANRAQQGALYGDWQRALKDIDAAAQRWEKTGYSRLRSLIAFWRASILRRSGDVSAAAEALVAAESLPRPESSGYAGDCFEARAVVYEGSARWDDAANDYRAAANLRAAAGDITGAAQAAVDAARVSARRPGSWSDAAEWAGHAATAWQVAAEADEYEPDGATRSADEDNARGVTSLFGSTRDPARARELFEAALDRVPDNRWYTLNLSTACAAAGEWAAAADALERALDGAPDHLRDTDLVYLLAQYRMKRAEDLEQHGEVEAALEMFGRARASMPDETDSRVILVVNRIGEGYLRLDRPDLALHEFQDGLGQARRLESDELVSIFERQLAVVAAVMDDATTALEHARTSMEHGVGTRWRGFWTLVQQASLAPPGRRDALRHVLRTLANELENGGEMDRYVTAFSIGRPPDWATRETLTLSHPSGQANIMVSTEAVAPETTTEEYAEAAGQQFRQAELADFREGEIESTQLADGTPALMRRLEWTPEEGEPVTQIQLYSAGGGRAVTATGTTLSASFRQFELELEQLLLTLAVSR